MFPFQAADRQYIPRRLLPSNKSGKDPHASPLLHTRTRLIRLATMLPLIASRSRRRASQLPSSGCCRPRRHSLRPVSFSLHIILYFSFPSHSTSPTRNPLSDNRRATGITQFPRCVTTLLGLLASAVPPAPPTIYTLARSSTAAIHGPALRARS
jgi:hypothetical protein